MPVLTGGGPWEVRPGETLAPRADGAGRYELSRPGDVIHVGVTKCGRIGSYARGSDSWAAAARGA
jgi:hypothetical protein